MCDWGDYSMDGSAVFVTLQSVRDSRGWSVNRHFARLQWSAPTHCLYLCHPAELHCQTVKVLWARCLCAKPTDFANFDHPCSRKDAHVDHDLPRWAQSSWKIRWHHLRGIRKLT